MTPSNSPQAPDVDSGQSELLTFGLIHALPTSDRRCLDRKEAASYVGVSAGTFDKLVRKGQMPSAVDLLGRRVWDRRALDNAIDAKMIGSTFYSTTADTPTLSPLDAWRSANG